MLKRLLLAFLNGEKMIIEEWNQSDDKQRGLCLIQKDLKWIMDELGVVIYKD